MGTNLGTVEDADSLCPVSSWCERGDSNPHGFTRQILSLVRLPIPPLSHEQDLSLLPLSRAGKFASQKGRDLQGDDLRDRNSESRQNESAMAEHAMAEQKRSARGGEGARPNPIRKHLLHATKIL